MVLAKTGLLKAFCGFKEDGTTLVYAKSDGTPKYTEKVAVIRCVCVAVALSALLTTLSLQDVIEMCVRNPLLIGVRATGYGSAENSKVRECMFSFFCLRCLFCRNG
jgi:hypothetical protein